MPHPAKASITHISDSPPPLTPSSLLTSRLILILLSDISLFRLSSIAALRLYLIFISHQRAILWGEVSKNRKEGKSELGGARGWEMNEK